MGVPTETCTTLLPLTRLLLSNRPAQVASVTVSASGGNCVANGTDVAAVYCEGPKLYSVSVR